MRFGRSDDVQLARETQASNGFFPGKLRAGISLPWARPAR